MGSKPSTLSRKEEGRSTSVSKSDSKLLGVREATLVCLACLAGREGGETLSGAVRTSELTRIRSGVVNSWTGVAQSADAMLLNGQNKVRNLWKVRRRRGVGGRRRMVMGRRRLAVEVVTTALTSLTSARPIGSRSRAESQSEVWSCAEVDT